MTATAQVMSIPDSVWDWDLFKAEEMALEREFEPLMTLREAKSVFYAYAGNEGWEGWARDNHRFYKRRVKDGAHD